MGTRSGRTRLLAAGAVSLFWRPALFETAKAALRALDYELIEITCSGVEAFKQALSDGLRWQDQFGYEPWTGNLNALNDGLRYPPVGEDAGLAICLRGFDAIAAEDPVFAHAVLDVIEYNSRHHLLHGRRLLALVQTRDAGFRADGLGARNAWWNEAEWLDANRGRN
jgi:hypothetical protein